MKNIIVVFITSNISVKRTILYYVYIKFIIF